MARGPCILVVLMLAGLLLSWPSDQSLAGGRVPELFAANTSEVDEEESLQQEGMAPEEGEADLAPDDFPAEEEPPNYRIPAEQPEDEEGDFEPGEDEG